MPAEPATPTGELKEFEVTEDFDVNPFRFFMSDGGLILCAGNQEKSNAMTIGWGGLGTLSVGAQPRSHSLYRPVALHSAIHG